MEYPTYQSWLFPTITMPFNDKILLQKECFRRDENKTTALQDSAQQNGQLNTPTSIGALP
jgi:hypothetical protein